ncbi:MAG: hypothetical protein AB4352_00150 [Hormoscilla sp.]
MNGWSRDSIISLLALIIAIIGLGTKIASSVIDFFQDEIKCEMGLSCAENSRSTVPPAIQPETADKTGTQPDQTPDRVEKGMSGFTVPTVPPAIQPETADKARTQPDPIPSCAEAEMAGERSSELENELYDLERRIAHMKCIAAQADCNKHWNQGNTCYLEGRLLSRAEFDRELAQMRLRISQINEILMGVD